MKNVGIIEFNSIPKGIENLDRVIKRANVEVYKAGVTCPGKYYFIIYGENEEIKEAIASIEGELKFEIISGVSNKLVEILERKNKKEIGNSIGIIEFFTISESVKTLDMILKNTAVYPLKLVLGTTLAGKSYFVVTGDTSSTVDAINMVDKKNCKDKSIVNNPNKEILKYL